MIDTLLNGKTNLFIHHLCEAGELNHMCAESQWVDIFLIIQQDYFNNDLMDLFPILEDGVIQTYRKKLTLIVYNV